MTAGHDLFRLYALVHCDHCPLPLQPRGMSRTLILRRRFPTVTTIWWGQLAGKTMTILTRILLLYCTAMVAYIYQTPTFPQCKSKITAHLPGASRPAQWLG